MTKKINDSFQTSLAQGGENTTQPFKPIIPGIFTSTTYQRDEDNQYRSGRVYSRADNPTYDAPEKLIAQLEHAADAKLFASGMAAATAVFQALKPGDVVLAPDIMYWALRNWLKGLATDAGLHVHFVDMTQLDQVENKITQLQPKLIWLETPGNPMWTVSDIRAIADIAKHQGARVAVDSTVATPILTRPLELGADIVMHS
ncbi:MAG TPA: cystathionine gamma-synthase, partial [Idiomarina sp.]|nr:cystathionine gamma-synthase [Idiomarina sp.]